jgi:hypothetical protein
MHVIVGIIVSNLHSMVVGNKNSIIVDSMQSIIVSTCNMHSVVVLADELAWSDRQEWQ